MHAGDVPISLTECARVLVDICYGGQSCSASHMRTVDTLLTDAVSRTATERVEELRLTGPVTACMQGLESERQSNPYVGGNTHKGSG